MIRINLLGRARPKAARQAVPLEATLQIVFFAASLLVAFGVLYYNWHSTSQQITEVRLHIQKQTGEKARLEQLKARFYSSVSTSSNSFNAIARAARSFWMRWPILSPAPTRCG
jgi:hypothetical protein